MVIARTVTDRVIKISHVGTGSLTVVSVQVKNQSRVDALSAAAYAGVEVRELATVEDLQSASDLLAQIWHSDDPTDRIPSDLLRALSFAGNYVAGAYDGDKLVGVALAFFGPTSLHSHVTGVPSPGVGTGRALKLHQRAWALERDV